MMTDPIADMLTRIRNANAVSQEETGMPSSKLKETIADLLVAEGYLDGYEVKPAGPGRELKVTLRYGANQERVIQGIRRISTPGRRVYASATKLPRAQGGLGVVVVSTSQGLMPDREARRRKLGGELICEVW
ncbi:MAG: 30S ribosomal protein S8 [Acidimicrobiia bacterium]|jgi:small subunit ribosomal protein S8|nr:30S ribosomal protein S8 [Acidimicrobiia bacterium]MDH5503595.1 30S ribosomal protein S8 [Acidimicrobiia bacterium]